MHCGDFESNIGKCCTGKTDDTLGCECYSCYSQSDCAIELLSENICPPDGSSCDEEGWVAYMKANPGEYYTPSTPYGTTQKSCGGCDDPPGSNGQNTNCLACASSVPSGGGGDCGCPPPPGPKVGCVSIEDATIPCQVDGVNGVLLGYTFTTRCCLDSFAPCGTNYISIDGCAGGDCFSEAETIIQGFLNAYNLGPFTGDGTYLSPECVTSPIGGGGGTQP